MNSLNLQTVVSFLDFSLGRHLKPRPVKAPSNQAEPEPDTLTDSVLARIQTSMAHLGINHKNVPATPAMLDVLASSINIMQVLITRSRLAGKPADVMITPLLADPGLMEFHRASTAFDAGRRAVKDAMPQLQARINGVNGYSSGGLFLRRNQRQLVHAIQTLDRSFTPCSLGAVDGNFNMNQLHRAPTAGVARAQSAVAVVFGHAAVNVNGNAGIQRAVGAAQHVNPPGGAAARTRFHASIIGRPVVAPTKVRPCARC